MHLLLPVPNDKEVCAFQALYLENLGIALPNDEAEAMLTHMVQFYVLIGGYERYKRNHPQTGSKRKTTRKSFETEANRSPYQGS